MTVQGLPVLWQDGTNNYHIAFVAGNISTDGNTADLIVFGNGNDWVDSGSDKSYTIMNRFARTQGTGNNQWQACTAAIGPQGVQGPKGDTGSQGATGASGTNASVTSVSNPTYALNAAGRQPNATKDVIVTACVKIDTTLSLSSGAAGTAKILSDSSTSPTTVCAVVASASTGTLTIGLNLVTSNTLTMSYRVKAGDYYRLPTTNDTGTPTFTLVSLTEQVLG